MHKRRRYNKSSYYARILFAISFVLLGYGFFLDYVGERRLIDPIRDVIEISDTNNSGSSTIHIDTSNGEGTIDITRSDNTDNTKTNDNTNNTTSTNNTNDINSVNSKTNNRNNSSNSTISSIDEANNKLRINIENAYGIDIKYGSETSGYSVSGISTEPITNPTTINSQLVRLENTLSVYPKGMFREIKNGGIPLTVLLISRYSDNTITGVTDSSYSYANISISASHPFEDSFYHESYHYIERYLFKRGANFNSWDSLNPSEFTGWGNINGSLSYSNTFSQTAPFVNNYAQTDAAEDRASTFEYMMASSKASCLNQGNTVWRKAKLMADTMDLVLSTVSPNATEYWERFL